MKSRSVPAMLACEKSLTKEEELRLEVTLIRYSELGSKESPVAGPLEAALLIALARQGEDYPYLNQNQFRVLLEKPRKATLSSAKTYLEREKFCRELGDKPKRALGIPVNGRDKYYRITPRGIKALAVHDKVTSALPSAIMDGLRNIPEYRRVLNELERGIAAYLKKRFGAAQETASNKNRAKRDGARAGAGLKNV